MDKKLTEWPKIVRDNSRELLHFSDFLNQVEVAMKKYRALKVFDSARELVKLAEKSCQDGHRTNGKRKCGCTKKQTATKVFPPLRVLLTWSKLSPDAPICLSSLLSRNMKRTAKELLKAKDQEQRASAETSTLLAHECTTRIKQKRTPSQPQCHREKNIKTKPAASVRCFVSSARKMITVLMTARTFSH